MKKVQVFSIQLRDALMRLSLRFPDRAPKEDQDKPLKIASFMGSAQISETVFVICRMMKW